MGVGGAWSEWSEREYTCTLYVVKLYMYMCSKCACVGEESAGGNKLGVVSPAGFYLTTRVQHTSTTDGSCSPYCRYSHILQV